MVQRVGTFFAWCPCLSKIRKIRCQKGGRHPLLVIGLPQASPHHSIIGPLYGRPSYNMPSDTMKTAVTVLQEMMVKMGQTPEYECVSQTGPQHQAMFDYRCVAYGVVVTASARSKKEAKQEVARLMLQQLSRRGHAVPPPYAVPSASVHSAPMMGSCAPVDARSYVALLKELCAEYRLAGVEYELVGDTGPPHLRHFTVRARIGQHERTATSTTKKTARQLAAEELYSYLRENLARVTRDFNEDDALVRAHEKAMERYSDADEPPRRPDLGQKIAEYHLGLAAGLDEETRAAALGALERGREQSPARALAAAAEAMRLRVEPAALEPLHVLTLTGCSPELTFAGREPAQAAEAALGYVRRALHARAPPLPTMPYPYRPTDPAQSL